MTLPILATSEKCSGHFETGINGAGFGEFGCMPSCICFSLARCLPTNSLVLCAISNPSACQVPSSCRVRYPSAEGSSHLKWSQTVLYGHYLFTWSWSHEKLYRLRSEAPPSLWPGLCSCEFVEPSWLWAACKIPLLQPVFIWFRCVLPRSAVRSCFQSASSSVSFLLDGFQRPEGRLVLNPRVWFCVQGSAVGLCEVQRIFKSINLCDRICSSHGMFWERHL